MNGEQNDDDELGRLLLDDKHRSNREDTRQSWRWLFFSVFFYLCFQLGHYATQAADVLYRRQPETGEPAASLADITWQPKAGIGSEEATSIVLGLAAFVVTINVAVFAARLSAPQDEASVLDLARWQRGMQRLAPRAGCVATAVTGTQIITNSGLGMGLLVVSALTMAASDLRIVGRLSALRMEVDSAKKFSDNATEQLDGLVKSLRPPVQKLVQQRLEKTKKGEKWDGPSRNATNGLALLVATLLVTLETVVLLILWVPESPGTDAGSYNVTGSSLYEIFVIWVVLLMFTWTALYAMVHAAAGKVIKDAGLSPKVNGSADVGAAAKWLQWVAIPLSIAFPVWATILANRGSWHVIFSCIVALAVLVVQHLLIRSALRSGRGPGMAAVWLAVADRVEDQQLAKRLLKEARAAHQEASRVHTARALQALADIAPQTVLQPPPMPVMQRIFAAFSGNGKSQ